MGIIYALKDREAVVTKGKILTVDPAVTKFVFSEGAKSAFTKTYDRFEFEHIENGNVFVTGKFPAFLLRVYLFITYLFKGF